MRTIVFTLFILFGMAFIFPLSCMAEGQTTPNASVSQLLQKVKSSSGDARRKAMNALKLKLRTVNAATRVKTMQSLRQAFGRGPKRQGQPNTSHTIHNPQQQTHISPKPHAKASHPNRPNRVRPSVSKQTRPLSKTPKHPTIKGRH